MNDIWRMISLGLTQGVTEWLPISSDGHLVLINQLWGVPEDLALDVFLHGASLLVLLLYFRKDIIQLTASVFGHGYQVQRHVVICLLLTTAITVPIALWLEPQLSQWHNARSVAYFLLVTSFFLILTIFSRPRAQVVTYGMAIAIGVFQGLAVLPGVSRSALTISVALLAGLSRLESFRYAFLAAIPALTGALIWKLKDMSLRPEYWLAFIITFISGYLTLFLLQKIVERERFHTFALYTVFLAIVILTIT